MRKERKDLQPRVDIVLATFNRAKLLLRTIETVFAQSYSDWRLIIVDDNSTDDTAMVIADASARDSRLGEWHAQARLACVDREGLFVLDPNRLVEKILEFGYQPFSRPFSSAVASSTW